MNGIILINKPEEFTSFDVVAKLRGILKTKKIGHAGTLDPMATGVLPVFVGKATRAIPFLENHDKKYYAEFRLGIVTDTQDISGNIIRENQVPKIELEFIEQIVKSFEGEQDQVPPMYSAVKVNGKKLYELARKGIEIERESRKVNFYSIDFLGKTEQDNTYALNVFCSKGSYIRTLCNDIGDKLGTGATLTKLIRTEACGYKIDRCYNIEDVQSMISQNDDSFFMQIDSAFENYPKLVLNKKEEELFLNGIRLDICNIKNIQSLGNSIDELCNIDIIRVYSETNTFLALANFDKDTEKLIIKRVFAERM